jgi:hypothetical protein
VDEDTRNGLPNAISLDSLGPVLFKGKQQSVSVFSVIS